MIGRSFGSLASVSINDAAVTTLRKVKPARARRLRVKESTLHESVDH